MHISRDLARFAKYLSWKGVRPWLPLERNAMTFHRIAHALYSWGYAGPALLTSQLLRLVSGIDIHPGATIASDAMFIHGQGAVIGAQSIIGSNVHIFQQVTLGVKSLDVEGMPTIESDVILSAGCKILGPIRIGANAIIGANAVVLNDIPPNAIAVGVPAKIVRFREP